MEINERYVMFAGSKSGGSQRIPVPFELEVDQDIDILINQYKVTFNVVKQETFSNQDGTVNVVYILKTTQE